MIDLKSNKSGLMSRKKEFILVYDSRRGVQNGRGGMAAGSQNMELRYYIFNHEEKAWL